MPEKIIIAEHVSKTYQVGKKRSQSFREMVSRSVAPRTSTVPFHALDDVSFEVEAGDVVAIVGKNGAGKSTLLKILSRITAPTEGRIIMDGKVASLLEVGTGFHPELTGRQNIFLNGAILGMRASEIKQKLDAIIDFSGIEQFIDTPIKRYSSGMYVRLAFAVAAHLEPDILIIDEVLAVGDAEFQRKCIGKMEEVATGGRTVLFVSHNLSAVSSLCRKGILLENGKLIMQGSVSEVIAYYTHNINVAGHFKNWNEDIGDEFVRPDTFRLIDVKRNDASVVKISEPLGIELVYEIKKHGSHPIPNFHIFTESDGVAFVTVNPHLQSELMPGIYRSIAWIPPNFLNEGIYTVGVALSTINPLIIHFTDYDALSFEVIDNLDSITRVGYNGKIRGAVRPILNWETEKI